MTSWPNSDHLFRVDDFGAAGDGSTDDSAAIQRAYDAAATVPRGGTTYRAAVVVFTPGSTYRVASASIVARPSVHTQGNGARLLGPIASHERITDETAIPSATDVDAQTAGGCFTDNEGDGASAYLYWPSFEDLVLDGFRFGFVARGSAWVHPVWDRIEFRNTDICVFAYQGMQQPTFRDWNAGNDTHAGFVAAATCFASGHPYAGRDNFFCDGLRVDCRRQTLNFSANADLDAWFESSILRPESSSIVSTGSSTFAPSGTFRKVSGRAIYIPSRNHRNLYGVAVGPLNLYGCPRGAALLRKPIDCAFESVSGEQMFANEAVNVGPDESMIVVGVESGFASGVFRNVNANHAAGGPNYKGAIDIVPEVATWSTHFVGENITGSCSPEHFVSLSRRVVSGGSVAGYDHQLRAASHRSIGQQSNDLQDLTTAFLSLAQGHNRALEDNHGHALREQFVSVRLPSAGGGQTSCSFNISGTPSADGIAQIVKGSLELFVERLDTGEMDYALYTCNLFQRFATSTTLAANVLAGATTIQVVSSGAAGAFSPGTPIIINNSEKARVLSRSGAILTLTTPLVGAFSSGQSVVAASSITNKIALTNAWITAVVTSGMLKITNAIDPVPIQVWIRMTYPKMEA